MNKNFLGLIALFTLGLIPFSTQGASPSVSETPLLVLIGASYVADWGTPAVPGYRVVNEGVGGQESHEVAARFERDVIARAPSKVLIWGHINNIHRAKVDLAVVAERAREDYRTMVAAARASGIQVLLATEVTLPWANGWKDSVLTWLTELRGRKTYATHVNEHVAGINSWLREYARAEGIPLLDFERELSGAGGYRQSQYTTPDGTHVSAEAYEKLTQSLRRALGT